MSHYPWGRGELPSGMALIRGKLITLLSENSLKVSTTVTLL